VELLDSDDVMLKHAVMGRCAAICSVKGYIAQSQMNPESMSTAYTTWSLGLQKVLHVILASSSHGSQIVRTAISSSTRCL
jgi:hypothetical protein